MASKIKNATGLAKGITSELQGQKEKVLKSKEKIYEIDDIRNNKHRRL